MTFSLSPTSCLLKLPIICFAVVWTTRAYDEKMFNVVFLCPKRLFQFNSKTVRTHFSSTMTLNNWKMIAETRSNIFRWRSRFRRRRVWLAPYCLSFQNFFFKLPLQLSAWISRSFAKVVLAKGPLKQSIFVVAIWCNFSRAQIASNCGEFRASLKTLVIWRPRITVKSR